MWSFHHVHIIKQCVLGVLFLSLPSSSEDLGTRLIFLVHFRHFQHTELSEVVSFTSYRPFLSFFEVAKPFSALCAPYVHAYIEPTISYLASLRYSRVKGSLLGFILHVYTLS